MLDDFRKIPIENKYLNDINPRDFGMFKIPPEFSNHQLNSIYYMYYVLSGTFHITVNDIVYHLPKGNLIIVPPNTAYEWENDPQDLCTIIWIGFDGTLAEKFAAAIPNYQCHYDGGRFREMLAVERLTLRGEYLAGLMFLLMQELSERNLPIPNNYVNQVKSYIETQYSDQNISINLIATAIGIDKRYMSRIFKSAEGMTPSTYLCKIRMEHALNLLFQNYSVSEVADMCGYKNVYYFSNLFKKYYSVPPSEYHRLTKRWGNAPDNSD